MVGKERKAWIRIIEAFLAIMLIASSLIIILNNQDFGDKDEIYELQREIVNIINKNDELRSDIVDGDTDNVNQKIQEILPSGLDFSTCVTNINDICSVNVPANKEVYTTEMIISSTLTQYNPKKLRFFVWSKG